MQEIENRDFIIHEIKNSLTLIKSAAKLLEFDKGEDKSLKVISDEADKINLNIDIFRNTYTNKIKEYFFISDIIKNNLSRLDNLLKEKKLIFNINIIGEEKQVFEYKHNITESIFNILKNAIEASYENKSIDINIIYNNDFVKIEISNYGDKIPDENKEKIFFKNFTTKQHGNGTGLYFCKKTFENAGGSLDFYNNISKKCVTFIVILPLNQETL